MAADAQKFLGARYVFGGSSPAGFDCSGFVHYIVLQALGISLGRDTYAQAAAGVPVSANQLQPGDLVFFQNTYRWGISHVGIYIGGGMMVSAANERTGVGVQPVWDGYWGPRFHSARRIA